MLKVYCDGQATFLFHQYSTFVEKNQYGKAIFKNSLFLLDQEKGSENFVIPKL